MIFIFFSLHDSCSDFAKAVSFPCFECFNILLFPKRVLEPELSDKGICGEGLRSFLRRLSM